MEPTLAVVVVWHPRRRATIAFDLICATSRYHLRDPGWSTTVFPLRDARDDAANFRYSGSPLHRPRKGHLHTRSEGAVTRAPG